MLVPYPIMTEKPGNFVAQFKMTVMITKGKTTALSGLPIDEGLYKTTNEIKDKELVDLLAVILSLFSNLWIKQSRRNRKPRNLRKRNEVCFYSPYLNHSLLINFYQIDY